MAIERAHHQNQAITALSGQCQRFFVLVRPLGHSRPEPQGCGGADWQIVIKRQDSSQRLVCRPGQQETQIAALQMNDDVASSGADTFDSSGVKLVDCERASALDARWNQRNDRWQNVGAPEYGRLCGGELRIDRERKAPNAE
jgi:hypothetical protein